MSVGGAYGGYPVNPATAASAIAPPIWGGNSCGLGASAGVQAPLFGISAGTQWEGENCEFRQRVALVSQIDKAAGKELACTKHEIYEAFKRSGSPCASNAAWDPKAMPATREATASFSPFRYSSRADCLTAANAAGQPLRMCDGVNP